MQRKSQAVDLEKLLDSSVMTFVTDKIGVQAKGFGDQLLGTAENLRAIAEQLREDQLTHGAADLATMGAERIDAIGRYLSTSDLEVLLADAESYSRQRPWTVALGGLVLGLSISRVVKATAARRSFIDAHPSNLADDSTSTSAMGDVRASG